MLEQGDNKKFNLAVASIKDPKYKKELYEYFERSYKIKLGSKGQVISQTEIEEWNRKSDEEKFNDAFGKLPFIIFGYVLEGGLLICIVLFSLQVFGVIDWFIPKETMQEVLGYFKSENFKKPINDEL